ncbi:LLM class flavin-dependent oxidoreductase [Streptomyces sp. NPDC093252]|uniref:LLM class flavin-dependent oxidoreductase n=1 Tax=Streptomyces sp. NPDC093252 TaxID=3154980 RepID=UPI0034216C4C
MTDGWLRLGVRLPLDAPGITYPVVERLTRTAERGLLDFVLADAGEGVVEGVAADGVGPPAADPVTVLSALAAVTERIGLVAGVRRGGGPGAARRVAALDRLSGGRAGRLDRTGEGESGVVGGGVVEASGEFGPGRAGGLGVPGESRPGRAGASRVPGAPGAPGAHGEVGWSGWPVVVVGRGDPGWASADLRMLGPVGVDGPPEEVAGRILGAPVRREGADGLLLAPRGVPDGLDAFVDRVIPLLRGHGVLRMEYGGATRRSHLGRSAPVRKG